MYEGNNTVITVGGHRHALRSQFGLSTFTSVPTIGYFGIGIGGMMDNPNVESNQLFLPKKPSEKNVMLYEPVPVYMIEKNNDLLPEDLGEYRNRTEITINGVEYYAYWLKKIKMFENDVKLYSFNVAQGVKEEYNLDTVNPAGNADNTNSIIATASFECRLTGTELQNTYWKYIPELIKNKKDLNLPIPDIRISELGVFCGSETFTETGDPAPNVDGMELVMHRCMYGLDLTAKTDVLKENIDLEQSGNILLTQAN